MFIPLHHKKSGDLFYIPVSHIVIIDQATIPNKENPREPGEKSTFIHTVISKGGQTLNFEVRESPDDVAILVNEILNAGQELRKLDERQR